MSEKIINLADGIEYSKDAIVSKTIHDKPAGTMTLFAFDENQGLSEHSAPYDAFVQIVDGEAEISINKVLCLLKKDEIIKMPANIPHALKAVKKFKMLLTMIKE